MDPRKILSDVNQLCQQARALLDGDQEVTFKDLDRASDYCKRAAGLLQEIKQAVENSADQSLLTDYAQADECVLIATADCCSADQTCNCSKILLLE